MNVDGNLNIAFTNWEYLMKQQEKYNRAQIKKCYLCARFKVLPMSGLYMRVSGNPYLVSLMLSRLFASIFAVG